MKPQDKSKMEGRLLSHISRQSNGFMYGSMWDAMRDFTRTTQIWMLRHKLPRAIRVKIRAPNEVG